MKHVAVVGLGAFGMGLARALARLGAKVVAVDNEPAHVRAVRDDVHTALVMDARDREALAERGIHEVECAVVCMGEDFTAAELCAVHLKDLGCPRVLVRGTSDERVEILQALGPEVITPGLKAASEMAVWILGDAIVDHCSLMGEHHIAITAIPASAGGQALSSLQLEDRYHVCVLAVRRAGGAASQVLVGPGAQHVLNVGDHLILMGSEPDLVDVGRALAEPAE